MQHFILTYGLLPVFVLMVGDFGRYRFEDAVTAYVAAERTSVRFWTSAGSGHDCTICTIGQPPHSMSPDSSTASATRARPLLGSSPIGTHGIRAASLPQFVRFNALYRPPRPVGGDSP
jgi:hypothetical protein